jgi:hypothetical protein
MCHDAKWEEKQLKIYEILSKNLVVLM